jgi:ribosomal protein S18 acetylase RimI-like enzyme
MDDTGGRDSLRVTTCDVSDGLRVASELFNRYRAHYGQSNREDGRTYDWLCEMVRGGRFQIFVASVDGQAIGIATAHEVPASLAMRTFWQLRDLYVLPEARRLGAGRAMVLGVRAAAEHAGATRLSLVTEPGNLGALALYDSLGFKGVDRLVSLSLELST